MRLSTSFLILLASAVVATACVGDSDEKAKKQKQALKAYILEEPPPDVGTKRGINYDNKVTLLGAKVEPKGTIQAGKRVKLTMFWKCNKEIGDKGWKLFTHVLDGSGKRILNIDNVGPLRRFRKGNQALPPSQWEEGKVYVDEQRFKVPKKVKTRTIQVTTGVWKGKDRLKIVGGPGDRENRGIAANIQVKPRGKKKKAARRTRVPELRVNKLEKGQSVKIDGKLDDKAWKTAASTGAFVDVRTGKPNKKFPVQGSAKVLWDDEALYLGFEVKDKDVVGGFDKKDKDPHLWTKDTVEIMVDPDGDGDNKDYYEIQINPQNLVFDSRFDAYNKPKKGPDGPFGHEDWTAKVDSAVTVNGTLDKSKDKDEGYVVEAKIPWKVFGKAKKAPPELGQTWRINFYAMQNNNGVAWSPILGQGNFHRASRFGKVLWAEKGWKPSKKKAKDEGEKKGADKKAADKKAAGKNDDKKGTAKKKAKKAPVQPAAASDKKKGVVKAKSKVKKVPEAVKKQPKAQPKQ